MDNNVNEIALSCRVRLARNIAGQKFIGKLDSNGASTNVNKVYNALKPIDKFTLYRMSDMDELDTRVLQEKRLISEELASNKESGAAIIDESEQISIMVNEEDHLRLQCFETGLDLFRAYNRIAAIDDVLTKSIGYSKDEKLGYLTSCITNVGTGMRAGALLFLPGLGMTQSIEKTIISLASNFKISVRGFFGEGSDNDGYFYQISNQRTLGITEQEILESVTNIIKHLAIEELKARQLVFALNKIILPDRVLRAYGIITNAYTLTSRELLEYAALVKLGHSLNILQLDDVKKIDNLIQECGPARIIAIGGDGLDNPIERDIFRAKMAAKAIKRIDRKN